MRSNVSATVVSLRQHRHRIFDHLLEDLQAAADLADFVAPQSSGKADYVGGFVVTAGVEEEKIAERYSRANDDYRSIMVKALADRFAEAFAERMHERVRKEFWAYAPDENLSPDDLLG